jgi:Flp pilus assembly pilin Flp
MEKGSQSSQRPTMRQLIADQCGATTLEWALLLAAIALPSYYVIRATMTLLVDHYRMMTAINAFPFP